MWKEFNSVVGKVLNKQHFVPGKGLHVLNTGNAESEDRCGL